MGKQEDKQINLSLYRADKQTDKEDKSRAVVGLEKKTSLQLQQSNYYGSHNNFSTL